MKSPLAIVIALILSLGIGASAQYAPSGPAPGATTAAPDINSVLTELQKVSLTTTGDLAKLKIEKWKGDNNEKQEMQQVANSLQKNITNAIPGLIADVQAAPGSVTKTFKLYHNLNVVYEFLNSLAESAGAFGKREEYEPLAGDATALDNVRQKLANYIEQQAGNLDSRVQQQNAAAPKSSQAGPKKIIVDNGPEPSSKPKKTSKKTAAAPPQ